MLIDEGSPVVALSDKSGGKQVKKKRFGVVRLVICVCMHVCMSAHACKHRYVII